MPWETILYRPRNHEFKPEEFRNVVENRLEVKDDFDSDSVRVTTQGEATFYTTVGADFRVTDNIVRMRKGSEAPGAERGEAYIGMKGVIDEYCEPLDL